MRILVSILTAAAILCAGSAWGEVQVVSFDVYAGPSVQVGPHVSGNTVVWKDQRNYSNGEIMGKNIDTGDEFLISPDAGAKPKELPDISGNWVVWSEYWGTGGWTPPWWELYGADLSQPLPNTFAIQTRPMSQREPAVGDDTCVWIDGRTAYYYQIYGQDLPGGSEYEICTGSVICEEVKTDGNIVVWQQYFADKGPYGERDIRGKVLGGGFLEICDESGNQKSPHVSGNIVVWSDFRGGGLADIYGKNLDTGAEFPICTHPASQADPVVGGGRWVVWEDSRNQIAAGYGPDLWGYDLLTGEEFLIASGGWDLSQANPDIDGNVVVWERINGSEFDIMGAYLVPEPSALVLLCMGAAGLFASAWRRRR